MIGKRKCTKCNANVPLEKTIGITKHSIYLCRNCGAELCLANPESIYWGFLGMLPMLIGALYGLSTAAIALLAVVGVGSYYYFIPLKVRESDT